MVGQTISHYSILERLGAGGMGEIYKAQDTRLNRFVAIKVLSLANSGDPERRRRFVQEAQAASALNHPNIITIYDIVSQDGLDFMVMEFVGGSTLSDLIPKEGMSVGKVLSCAVQMTDALGTAHAAGIIHRDLKPGNVMVTGTGLVKILDFGLAKLTGPASIVEQTDETLPLSAPLTVEGSILGTVSYMSPEQAEARRVDARSDIFSFGLVLYEMLTGSKAFVAASTVSTLSKILRDEAKPIHEVVQSVPPELEQIVSRAMRKDPDQRWQSMTEMHAALAALKQRLDSSVMMKPPARAPQKPPMALVLTAAAIVVVGLGSGGLWLKHRADLRRQAAAQVAQTQSAPAPAPQIAAPAPVPEVPSPDAPAPAGATDATAAALPADSALTNQAVLDMLQAKVPTSVIVSHIRSSKNNKFDLSTAEIIKLSKSGAPAEVIEAMRNPRGFSARSTLPNLTSVTPVTPVPPPVTPPSTPATTPVTNSSSAAAATPPPPPPAPVAAAPAAAEHTLPKGRPVTVPGGVPLSIALTEDIPANPSPGLVLHFTVAKDFKVGDTVVVAKGTPLTGQIFDAGGERKMLIKKTKATFRVSTVTAVDGSKLAIRAAPGKRADKVDAPIEPPGYHDKDKIAPAGGEFLVYLDGDQAVTIRK